MTIRSLKDSFLKFCEENKFEKNANQLKIIGVYLDLIANWLKKKPMIFFHHLLIQKNIL